MTKMVPHICGSCASHLVLDKENSVFVCESCGCTFDYDYFMEDSVIKAAEESLQNGDFHAAEKAYSFMLSKEPHNAWALRGLELFELNARNTSMLFPDGFDFKGKMNYDRYISDSPEEYKEYFRGIKTLKLISSDMNRISGKMDELKPRIKHYKEHYDSTRDIVDGGWKNETAAVGSNGEPVTRKMQFINAGIWFGMVLTISLLTLPKLLETETVDIVSVLFLEACLLVPPVLIVILGSIRAKKSVSDAAIMSEGFADKCSAAELEMKKLQQKMKSLKDKKRDDRCHYCN